VDSLLNTERPPAFCPGCGHLPVAHALDKAFAAMGLTGSQIVIVSDIGCSGLFDVFFNTHAMHGLHGRALTYATGLKMARPELNVIVTMGDGGLGIGGAHILAACRRNLDLTLLVLNNFNFGMTGGQFSSTTPPDATVASAFLNLLEKPMDICQVACSAGATYTARCSAYTKSLPKEIEDGIRHPGFSLIDIWGICPGRYTKRSQLTPGLIHDTLEHLPPMPGVIQANEREEYGSHYRKLARRQDPPARPIEITPLFSPPQTSRQEIVLLGGAGQRVITAGEIICYAGLSAGLMAAQRNEYNITVLRGPSVSEIILSPDPIGFIGIEMPTVLIAIDQEGIDRRTPLFGHLNQSTLLIQADDVTVPDTAAQRVVIHFNSQKIRPRDRALASISALAKMGKAIDHKMLQAALALKFKDKMLENCLQIAHNIEIE
jgi:2-oxoglutarate ferredoxin oxidoreductase subunit beta